MFSSTVSKFVGNNNSRSLNNYGKSPDKNVNILRNKHLEKNTYNKNNLLNNNVIKSKYKTRPSTQGGTKRDSIKNTQNISDLKSNSISKNSSAQKLIREKYLIKTDYTSYINDKGRYEQIQNIQNKNNSDKIFETNLIKDKINFQITNNKNAEFFINKNSKSENDEFLSNYDKIDKKDNNECKNNIKYVKKEETKNNNSILNNYNSININSTGKNDFDYLLQTSSNRESGKAYCNNSQNKLNNNSNNLNISICNTSRNVLSKYNYTSFNKTQGKYPPIQNNFNKINNKHSPKKLSNNFNEDYYQVGNMKLCQNDRYNPVIINNNQNLSMNSNNAKKLLKNNNKPTIRIDIRDLMKEDASEIYKEDVQNSNGNDHEKSNGNNVLENLNSNNIDFQIYDYLNKIKNNQNKEEFDKEKNFDNINEKNEDDSLDNLIIKDQKILINNSNKSVKDIKIKINENDDIIIDE